MLQPLLRGGGGVEKSIKVYDDKEFNENDVIIISTLNFDFTNEILEHCKNAACNIYLDNDIYYNGLFQYSIYNLDKVSEEEKKIFYLTRYAYLDNRIINFLELFGFEIINKNHYNIENLYKLLETNEPNFIIVISERDNIKRVKILDELNTMGFSPGKNNVVGCQYLGWSRKYLLGKNNFVKDALCGHAQKYESLKFCGWKILKNDNIDRLKVMILGGSTSTEELFYPETWMRKLYKKLNKLNLNCAFYIGASGSYSILHEFLRFLRDGHIIKPNVIISMSGLNVTGNRFNNRFNLDKQISDNEYITGLPSAENCYEYWLRIEKMFKLHTDSLNIKFFPFLQPMNGWFPNASVVNRLVSEFEEDYEDCKDFCSNANENDIYTNLIDLFKNQPEMLIDNCHYTDKAADILSDKVLETILPTITEIYARK